MSWYKQFTILHWGRESCKNSFIPLSLPEHAVREKMTCPAPSIGEKKTFHYSHPILLSCLLPHLRCRDQTPVAHEPANGEDTSMERPDALHETPSLLRSCVLVFLAVVELFGLSCASVTDWAFWSDQETA